uniref:alpha-E domain-containing protein n=1 Tax=Nocardia aurantia TaxID=2585199 RepID=UPI001D103616
MSRVTGTPAPLAIAALPQPDPAPTGPASGPGSRRPTADEPLLRSAEQLELPPPQQQSRAAEHWRTAAGPETFGRPARRSPEAPAAQRHSPESDVPVGPVGADAVTADPIAWSDRIAPAHPVTAEQAGLQGADAPPGPDPTPPTPPRPPRASEPAAVQHDSLPGGYREPVGPQEPTAPSLDGPPLPNASPPNAQAPERPEASGFPDESVVPGDTSAAGSGGLGRRGTGGPAGAPERGEESRRSSGNDSPSDRDRSNPIVAKDVPAWLPPVVGASPTGHGYLVRVSADRELPGSLAYAIEHFGADARAVRDQLSADTWMVSSAMDRAMAQYRAGARDQEAALAELHAAVLAALLALSGMDAESMVRDTGWYVADIGKRIERGIALTALLAAAFTQTYPDAVQRIVTEAVLRATESVVSYRRRHRDSIRVAAVASLLLFDAANPRSLAHQLERLEADLQALPGASGSSRPQRLLAEAQRMLSRLDPADLEVADAAGRRTVFAELIEGVHLRLRTLSEAFETSRLAGPGDIQPLWGNTRVVE